MSSLPAGAELGATTDPKELIRGSAEAVENTAREFREKGSQLETIGDDLGRVRIDGWQGPASNAFWDQLATEKPRWYKAADSLTEAADALTVHAEAISAAQSKAAEAIELWDKGEAATRNAKAEYDAAVAEANRQGQAGNPAADIQPFSDPGEKLRQEARDVLDRAREQLDGAGADSAGIIDGQRGQGSDTPNWLAAAGTIAQNALGESGFGNTSIGQEWAFGDGDGPVPDGDMRTWGEEFSESSGGPQWSIDLAQADGNVSMWDWGTEGSTSVGDVDLSGDVSADALGAQGTAAASFGSDGLKGELSGRAYLAQAAAAGNAEWGILAGEAQAEAFVGGEAGVEGSVDHTGMKVGGEAFAGGKIEGSVSGDVGGVGAGATAEGWAGVGAAADLQIGMDEGEFKVGGEVGAGLGVGGKVGGDISIDPEKVTETVTDAADSVGDAAGSAASTVGDAAGSAWDNTFGRL